MIHLSGRKIKRSVLFLLLIAWMCLIFSFSGEAAEASDDKSEGLIETLISSVYPDFDTMNSADRQYVVESFSAPVRKAAHFTEFFILGALFYLFFETFTALSRKLRLMLPLLLGLLYGISDEVHQYFVPGRACRITDIYIDFCGVLLAVVFLFLICSRGEKIEQ